jgi:hypothetical protein
MDRHTLMSVLCMQKAKSKNITNQTVAMRSSYDFCDAGRGSFTRGGFSHTKLWQKIIIRSGDVSTAKRQPCIIHPANGSCSLAKTPYAHGGNWWFPIHNRSWLTIPSPPSPPPLTLLPATRYFNRAESPDDDQTIDSEYRKQP